MSALSPVESQNVTPLISTTTTRAKPRRATALSSKTRQQLRFIEQLMRDKEMAWARLSPAEQREERRKFRKFARTLNESRPHRQVLREFL